MNWLTESWRFITLGGFVEIFGSVLESILRLLNGNDKDKIPPGRGKIGWGEVPSLPKATIGLPEAYGLDCEMVGVRAGGRESQLARVTLVMALVSSPVRQSDFKVVYDVIVKPVKKVTDYRTKYSGINKEILSEGLPGVPLVTFEEAKKVVGEMIMGKGEFECGL